MWTDQNQEDLKNAINLLENPGFIIKLTNFIGKPVEYGIGSLSEGMQQAIGNASSSALNAALKGALLLMSETETQESSDLLHKLMVGTTGMVGGFVGLAALPVELPATTVLMMRSIADIARSEGEDIRSPETALNCVSVFALGSDRSTSDDNSEIAYYAVRAALSKYVGDAVAHLASKNAGQAVASIVSRSTEQAASAPVLIKLITTIAARFNIVVSEKVLAQSIPVIGAIGGATVNTLFMNHYQNMARGHFIVRRLGRLPGVEGVRQRYAALSQVQPKLSAPASA